MNGFHDCVLNGRCLAGEMDNSLCIYMNIICAACDAVSSLTANVFVYQLARLSFSFFCIE